jgi:hypothetical protein
MHGAAPRRSPWGKPYRNGLAQKLRGCGESAKRRGEVGRLEDVKKLISRSFRDFSFEPKYIPTFQRSLLGHPGAAILYASEETHLLDGMD